MKVKSILAQFPKIRELLLYINAARKVNLHLQLEGRIAILPSNNSPSRKVYSRSTLTRIAIIMLLILLFSTFVYAGPFPEIKKQPSLTPFTKVWTNIYLIDIDYFNLMNGSYRMTFYLGFHCLPNCNDLHYELMNGNLRSQETYIDKPDDKLYRITADLDQNFDFRKYPFESHYLNIEIEDKFLTTKHLLFIPDRVHSGLDGSISLLGWLQDPFWSVKTINHYYANFGETYSKYIYTMELTRPIVAGILKNIIPGTFIMFIGFLSLFLDTYKAINGLAITSGALVSMVVLHLGSSSSIPPNDYLTYLDSFMVINYACLILLLAEIIFLMNASQFSPIYYSIYKYFRRSTPLIWLSLQLFAVSYFFILH